jgi:DNA-binding winged helix-turn-helix (wHTH) protein
MIKQNIFIINYNSLYEILNEIKVNLSFQIIKYENEESFINDNHLDLENSLIISSPKNKLLVNKNNLFNFKKLPISLSKLVESINIQLLQLKFNYQSKISIKGYDLNLNSKFLSMNDLILKLTEKEIEIILYLTSNKDARNILDLQKNIWGYSSDMETHTVETHIYRLRKKISNKFKDDNFILSDKDGYFISQKSV